AVAAGIRAGVTMTKRQWMSIERVAALAPQIPDALKDVLPLGLVSDSALARGCALRLAERARARSAIEAARATTDKKALQRLDEALAALAEQPSASAKPDLLPRLLEAYKTTFDPALDEPIARLGAQESRRRGPLRAKSKSELEAVWLALANKK